MIQNQNRVQRPTREAADWFTRLSHPSIEADELEAFSTWRKDPANRAAYEKIEDISRSMTDLRDDPDLRLAAAEALGRGAARGGRTARRRPSRRAAVIGSLAAACVIGALGGVAAWRAPTYSTRVGETFSATLQDGSRVQLNTDSAVKVRYSAGQRRVELLRGQALFQVAHNAARPFIVAAGRTEVRALGTRFEVRRTGSEVRVVLAQGSVEISDQAVRAAPWRLKPGQTLALAPETSVTAVPVAIDVPSATSWTTGDITFQEVPLSEAVAELNRYSRGKIILGPGVPTDRRVSGVFSAGDNEDFVAAVSSLYRLKRVSRATGDIELQPEEPATS